VLYTIDDHKAARSLHRRIGVHVSAIQRVKIL